MIHLKEQRDINLGRRIDEERYGAATDDMKNIETPMEPKSVKTGLAGNLCRTSAKSRSAKGQAALARAEPTHVIIP